MPETILYSPLGALLISEENSVLQKIIFLEDNSSSRNEDSATPLLQQTCARLHAYFRGEPAAFDLPVDAEGTEFQQHVWRELRRIHRGATLSYAELAQKIGKPKAVRAVGRAVGQNPLPIIIPCHRVIGSDHRLTGYSGGLERKKWLLRHEGALLL